MSVKFAQLFKLLLSKTRSGELIWEETADPDTFLVTIGKNKVSFALDDFGISFNVVILGADGQPIDKFNDDDLSKIERRSWFSEGTELIGLIRRRISGAEQTLDAILAELEKDDDIPF